MLSLTHGTAQTQQDLVSDSLTTDSLTTDTLASDTIVIDSAEVKLSVQERIERLLDTDMFETSQLGLVCLDLTADTIIYQRGARQTLRPASTMKLLTAITALDHLGDSYRFTTTLTGKGTLVTDSLGKHTYIGDIVIRGGMDPRFSSDDMASFVECITQQGIDTICGNIRADRKFKDDKLLGEGWCWDDKNPILSPLLYSRKDNFIDVFSQRLRDAGVVIVEPDGERAEPSEPMNISCSRHHTLGQVLTRMMKESDNWYAESMFYQIGATDGTPSTAKKSVAVMKQLIKKLHLNTDRYRIADGCGLSLYNYQTAELQAQLLRYAYHNADIYNNLYRSLPIAGVDGTLSKRMRGTKAQGNVHAKTGTLSSISSLSGYLRAECGNDIAFVIINQGIMHAANAKRFQDKVCLILCDY